MVETTVIEETLFDVELLRGELLKDELLRGELLKDELLRGELLREELLRDEVEPLNTVDVLETVFEEGEDDVPEPEVSVLVVCIEEGLV